jgi:hypothetical protein
MRAKKNLHPPQINLHRKNALPFEIKLKNNFTFAALNPAFI